MRKTFKYRLLGNKETFSKAENWLKLCCHLYNCTLEERIFAWKMQRHSFTFFDQQYELPEIKKLYPEYNEINAQVLQNVIERLDRAYGFFFRRVKRNEKAGFPRFKNNNRYNSFTLKRWGWKLEGKYLSIRNIGRFKLRLSRPIEGKIKEVIIRNTSTNKWYVCFSCNNVPPKLLPKSDNVVGLDVGIKSFLTDSESNHINNPRFLVNTSKELRVRHRALDRAIINSHRRIRTKLLLSKVYEKIKNQRRDFHHKLANKYIKEYGVIVFEKLQISNMVRNPYFSRDIGDCAWGQFFEYLCYKAEDAGRIIIKNNPPNTSTTCHVCGTINKTLRLSNREWVCQNCGTLQDRDENAAFNHKKEGIEYLKRLGQSQRVLTKEDALCVACKSPSESVNDTIVLGKNIITSNLESEHTEMPY
jgi:putative transposase